MDCGLGLSLGLLTVRPNAGYRFFSIAEMIAFPVRGASGGACSRCVAYLSNVVELDMDAPGEKKPPRFTILTPLLLPASVGFEDCAKLSAAAAAVLDRALETRVVDYGSEEFGGDLGLTPGRVAYIGKLPEGWTVTGKMGEMEPC